MIKLAPGRTHSPSVFCSLISIIMLSALFMNCWNPTSISDSENILEIEIHSFENLTASYVDLYLYNSSGTLMDSLLNASYNTTWEVPAGTGYTVKAYAFNSNNSGPDPIFYGEATGVSVVSGSSTQVIITCFPYDPITFSEGFVSDSYTQNAGGEKWFIVVPSTSYTCFTVSSAMESDTGISVFDFAGMLVGSLDTKNTEDSVTISTTPGYSYYIRVIEYSAAGEFNLLFEPVELQRNWTIMVWLDADNNLEEVGMKDINEMEYGLYLAQQGDPNIESKLSIVLQVDRIDGYDSNPYDRGSDWTDTRRYVIKPDSDPSQTSDFTSMKIQDLGEINMGDANNLKSFIAFCKDNYTANNYALILWNHGGGVRVEKREVEYLQPKDICWDYTDNSDRLYIAEITDVLTDNEDVNVIGFDACFMMMVEIAYEYRPIEGKFGANYMVGSPYTEPWAGWPYDKIINRFKGSGFDGEGDVCYDVESLTQAQLASLIVKEYEDAFSNSPSEILTAIDLSKAQAIKDALDQLAVELVDEKVDAEDIRGSNIMTVTMEYFNETSEDEWINFPHFDLYDFAERISNSTNFTANAKSAASLLMSTVEDCVIESWGGFSYQNFQKGKNGLGFFFPDGDRAYNNDPIYAYQWWYTAEDTNQWFDGHLYGRLDFCNSDADGTVEGWRELLEFWFDNSNEYTPSSW